MPENALDQKAEAALLGELKAKNDEIEAQLRQAGDPAPWALGANSISEGEQP